MGSKFWSWAAVSLFALVGAACGGSSSVAEAGSALVGATPTDLAQGPVPTAEQPEPSVSKSPTPAQDEKLELDLDLGFESALSPGLITSTGVPVAVLGQIAGQTIVRTPCGATAVVSGGTRLSDVAVVLDPGHGGPADPGAVGPNGLVESDLNLRLVDAALRDLRRRGIGAASTRSGDYLTTLRVRSEFADDLGARVMISVHHNAPNAAASDAPGTEVFVQSNSPMSRRLGGLVQSYVTEALSGFGAIRWTSAGDAGVLLVLNTEGTDAYGMIRRPETPTALVELGYISNAAEASLFTTRQYVEVAAVALVDAAEAFLTTTEPGSGFVDEPRVFDPARAPGAEVCTDPELG